MEKEEKIIYSTPADSGFLSGTLEIYSDRLILIGKKKNIEYKFIDIAKVSNFMTSISITLKNGYSDSIGVVDKKHRMEIIDYINNQLTTTNTDTKSNNQIEKKDIKENLTQNTSNETPNNASGNNIFKTISAIISAIVLVIIVFNFFGGGNIEGGDDAVFYALREIPESVLTFDDVMSNELKCEAKEKTDDEIILVQCTTTNQDVIDHYDSETIWYGYQETADGRSHYRSINKSKDKVLENMRKN